MTELDLLNLARSTTANEVSMLTVFASLKALPARTLSEISKHYLEVNDSWLGYVASFVFNSAFYILWLGVFYLLFFWKKQTTAGRSDSAS